MSHHDLTFDINYSYYVEDMMSTILGRTDKLISIFLFILGGLSLSQYSSILFFGICVSVLSALQFFFQFGGNAAKASEQSKKYQLLTINAKSMPVDELRDAFCKISDSDSRAYKFVKLAAYKRVCIKLNLDDETDKLNWLQSSLAWLAGDNPKPSASIPRAS